MYDELHLNLFYTYSMPQLALGNG